MKKLNFIILITFLFASFTMFNKQIFIAEGENDIRYEQGKVLIGKGHIQKPPPYKLYVEGGVLTENVKVCIKNSADWSDDVFDKNYPLKDISTIEAFIQKNHHLPNLPSADEVVKNGIDVAEMDAALLRQIEELWLHLIALKKENELLKHKIHNQ